MSPSFRFPKSERLRHRKDINSLFLSGESFSIFPFRVVYRHIPRTTSSLMFAVAVPKKNIKLAVNRNRIKRQTREAWRLNCHGLKERCESQNITLQLLLVYNGKELPEYALLQSKIILILQRLQEVHERIAH